MNGNCSNTFFHLSAFLAVEQKTLTSNRREMDDEKLAHKANEHTTSETSVGWMTVMWTEAANYDDDIVTLWVARSPTPAANPFFPQLDLLSILEKAKMIFCIISSFNKTLLAVNKCHRCVFGTSNCTQKKYQSLRQSNGGCHSWRWWWSHANGQDWTGRSA